MAKVTEVTYPRCGICLTAYADANAAAAARCCTCDKCGLDVPENAGHYTDRHKECQKKAIEEAEAKAIEKAEKLEAWDGPVVLGNDHYFQDVESLAEYLEDELEPTDPWPDWVHVCEMAPFPTLDFDAMLENLTEEHGLDDFGVDDIDVPLAVMDGLEAAVKAFNEAAKASKHNQSWHPDPKRVVRVPQRDLGGTPPCKI